MEVSSEGPPLRASSHTLTQSVFYVTTKRRKKKNHRTCHWRLSKAHKRGLWRWWRDPVLHVHVSREQQQQQQQQPAGLFSITGVAALLQQRQQCCRAQRWDFFFLDDELVARGNVTQAFD